MGNTLARRRGSGEIAPEMVHRQNVIYGNIDGKVHSFERYDRDRGNPNDLKDVLQAQGESPERILGIISTKKGLAAELRLWARQLLTAPTGSVQGLAPYYLQLIAHSDTRLLMIPQLSSTWPNAVKVFWLPKDPDFTILPWEYTVPRAASRMSKSALATNQAAVHRLLRTHGEDQRKPFALIMRVYPPATTVVDRDAYSIEGHAIVLHFEPLAEGLRQSSRHGWRVTLVDVNGSRQLVVPGWLNHVAVANRFFSENKIIAIPKRFDTVKMRPYYGLTRAHVAREMPVHKGKDVTQRHMIELLQTQENFHSGEDLCAWHAIRICSVLAAKGDVLRSMDTVDVEKTLADDARHPFKTTYWLYAAYAYKLGGASNTLDSRTYEQYASQMAYAQVQGDHTDPSPMKEARGASAEAMRSYPIEDVRWDDDKEIIVQQVRYHDTLYSLGVYTFHSASTGWYPTVIPIDNLEEIEKYQSVHQGSKVANVVIWTAAGKYYQLQFNEDMSRAYVRKAELHTVDWAGMNPWYVWRTHWDAATGLKYYINVITKKSVWEKPALPAPTLQGESLSALKF